MRADTKWGPVSEGRLTPDNVWCQLGVQHQMMFGGCQMVFGVKYGSDTRLGFGVKCGFDTKWCVVSNRENDTKWCLVSNRSLTQDEFGVRCELDTKWGLVSELVLTPNVGLTPDGVWCEVRGDIK